MRIRRIAAASAFIIFCLSFAVGAGADAVTEARKAVQAVYDRRNAAAVARDPKGILADCAPDFVYITNDGQKRDLKTLKKRIAPLLALAQNLKASTLRQKFALKGKEVTTTVKTHLESVFVNPNTQAASKLVVDDVSEDVWIKTEKGWLQKRKKTLSDVMTMDGKPINTKIDLSKDPGKAK